MDEEVDEVFFSEIQQIAGLARIAEEALTVAAANAKLSEYHRERRQALATE